MTLRLELATVQLTLIGSGGSGVGRDGSPHFGPLLLPKVGTCNLAKTILFPFTPSASQWFCKGWWLASSCWNRRVESLIES